MSGSLYNDAHKTNTILALLASTVNKQTNKQTNMYVNVEASAWPDGSLFGGFILPSNDQSFLSFLYSNANIDNLLYMLKTSGLDLAARYSQKCEWVFQIFPFLRVIKSITRKFLRVDLILIKLIYNVKVLKSVKLKLTQVFVHMFSRQTV